MLQSRSKSGCCESSSPPWQFALNGPKVTAELSPGGPCIQYRRFPVGIFTTIGKSAGADRERGSGTLKVSGPNQRLKLTGAAILGFPSFNVVAGGPGGLALAFCGRGGRLASAVTS